MFLDEDDGSIEIEICCQNHKLDSFWSGEWLSQWSLNDGQLSGLIKSSSHYFEIGNLQFNLGKEFESVSVQNPNDAVSIAAAIKATEDEVSVWIK